MKPGKDYIGVSVAFFCHDGKGNFLFHQRSQKCRDEQGTWDCGGGKIEFGETLEEGLMRELREEYGCSGTIEEALPVNSYIRTDGEDKRHWVIIPYIMKVNPEEARLNEPESMDAIGWYRLDALPEPLHSGMKMDMEMYREFLKRYS
jgi:ADP-ribose pyrophosphatase YjhB (NUDIX family)